MSPQMTKGKRFSTNEGFLIENTRKAAVEVMEIMKIIRVLSIRRFEPTHTFFRGRHYSHNSKVALIESTMRFSSGSPLQIGLETVQLDLEITAIIINAWGPL